MRAFCFAPRPGPGPEKAQPRSLQVRGAGEPRRASRSPAVGARGSCTIMLPSFLLPSAFSQKPTCEGSRTGRARWRRGFGGLRPGRGDLRPRAKMHSHPSTGSRSDHTPGARPWGLTERGSLAGPGPKLTTCVGALMVRQRGRPGQRREACAARVCCERRPSVFSQRPAGATIGPRSSRPCANWFALRGSHPHWSCSTAKAQEQLLLLSCTVSTLF